MVNATPELIDLAENILQPKANQTLVVADAEHFAGELIADSHQRTGFDLLVPIPNQPAHRRRFQTIPHDQFTRRWAGFATTKLPYEIKFGKPGTYWQFVERFGEPFCSWDANHLAKDLFFGMEGDVRVTHDTIVVTYYNAPNAQRMRDHYEDLPEKLTKQSINPEIPWLYNYKLDFRFR